MVSGPIAIIGGGISAPILAISLQKYGITSLIFEARPEKAIDEGTITLTPNSLRILDEFGLYDKIRSEGGSFEVITAVSTEWKELGQLKVGSIELYGYESIRVQRQIVRKIAIERAIEGGAVIHYNYKCATVSEQNGSVMMTFTNGQTYTSDFAVGADGFYSTVRQQVIPNASAPEYTGLLNLSGTVLRRDLNITDNELHLPSSAIGPNNFFAFMPENKDHSKVSFLASFNYPEESRSGWDALSNDANRLKALLEEQYCRDPWPQWLQVALKSLRGEDIRAWPYHKLPSLSTWLSPTDRIAVIGDAAHGIPPTGAQGANSAIEDARTLAYALSKATSRENSSALLHKWDDNRRKRMTQISTYTMANHKNLALVLGPWAHKTREWVMWGILSYVMPKDSRLTWLNGYRWESVLD